MKKVIFGVASIVLILNFTVYGNPNEEVKTVEYYKAHTNERKNKIDVCLNNPGELRNTPNCINANKAQLDSGIAIDPSKAPDAKKYQNF